LKENSFVTPETLSDQRSVPASDLWQLGAIMYTMHVGKLPFEGKKENLFKKILNLDF